jgi:hypothetical protein
MDDKASVNEEVALTVTDRSAALSTVGYLCIAITWWMTGMLMTGWFTAGANIGTDTGILYSVGSVLLVIIGILSVVYGRRLVDTVVFLAAAGLFFSLNRAHGSFTGTMASAYVGWWGLVWAVFFCYTWIASLGSGDIVRMLFLLLFWLGMLALAINGWTGSHGFFVLSGYLLLITAILAFIVSALAILRSKPEAMFRKNVRM